MENVTLNQKEQARLQILNSLPSEHMTVEQAELKALGKSIYKEQVQARIGPVEGGTFVVIDDESGYYEIDASDAAATRRLLTRRPHAVTYGARGGYRAAYRHSGGTG